VQIEVGVTRQGGGRQDAGADGEAQEQGIAVHGNGSRKQAATLASDLGQKPNNSITGL
jgi:hypothetical protein